MLSKRLIMKFKAVHNIPSITLMTIYKHINLICIIGNHRLQSSQRGGITLMRLPLSYYMQFIVNDLEYSWIL